MISACLLLSLFAFPAERAIGDGDGVGLVQRYRQAHEAGDLQALMALVHWEGANERTREIVERRLSQYLGYRIEEIELRPLSGDEEFASSGYRPNLKPVGWLAMTFESPIGEDSRLLGQVFVVGERDGNPLITVAVPKP